MKERWDNIRGQTVEGSVRKSKNSGFSKYDRKGFSTRVTDISSFNFLKDCLLSLGGGLERGKSGRRESSEEAAAGISVRGLG